MQSSSEVLKKMSSRAQRPAVQEGTAYHISVPLHCGQVVGARWFSCSPGQVDNWVFEVKGCGRRFWFSHLLS